MATIHDIPIDAWVVVLRHLAKSNIVDTFNRLVQSRAINIPLHERLNTFWIVVSQSRHLDMDEQLAMPDVEQSKHTYKQLRDMGLHDEHASEMVRRANGDLNIAFMMLGWTD